MLKHGILGLLNYGEMTGYEIMTAFRDSLGFFWTASTSQIYRELQTLRDRGFATDRLVVQDAKPDKKVFSITEEGKRELRRWLQEEIVNRKTNFPTMMKVFFAGELPTEACLSLFQRIRAESKSLLGEMGGAFANAVPYKEIVRDERKTRLWDMTMDFADRYHRMMQEWCDQCISVLAEEEACGPEREQAPRNNDGSAKEEV